MTSASMGSLTTPAPPSVFANDTLLIAIPFHNDSSEKWATELETHFPGLKVRCANQPPKFPPNPLPEELFEGVTMLCTLWPHPAEKVKGVRYVQLVSAGADAWTKHELYKNPDVVFCTANGAHA